jgi:hypothetical protein
MTDQNRVAVDRSSPVGSTQGSVPSVVATRRLSRRQPVTPTPNALREEAIDYCLQCARYEPDSESSDCCIYWDTCEERLEHFPLVV